MKTRSWVSVLSLVLPVLLIALAATAVSPVLVLARTTVVHGATDVGGTHDTKPTAPNQDLSIQRADHVRAGDDPWFGGDGKPDDWDSIREIQIRPAKPGYYSAFSWPSILQLISMTIWWQV